MSKKSCLKIICLKIMSEKKVFKFYNFIINIFNNFILFLYFEFLLFFKLNIILIINLFLFYFLFY